MKIMSENNIFDARMAKLDYVKNIVNPYPEKSEKTHEINLWCIWPRKLGKMSLNHIADLIGKIQIVVKRDVSGNECFEF